MSEEESIRKQESKEGRQQTIYIVPTSTNESGRITAPGLVYTKLDVMEAYFHVLTFRPHRISNKVSIFSCPNADRL